MPHPLLIAHRGAPTEAPENTLAAFSRALTLGVDGVELDVRVTRDGCPVVFHDATLSRLCGIKGRIARLGFDELRPIRLRGEALPRLEEALDLICPRAVAQVEIKEGVPVAPVVRAIRRAGSARRAILASFDRAAIREARDLAPRVPRMLISYDGRPATLERATSGLEVTGVSLDRRALRSPARLAALHARGWQVWCWTVNRPAVMLRFDAWGADALLSDNPALLVSTLRSF